MAVQVSNDNDINPVNPIGLQYIVEAVLDGSQPCIPHRYSPQLRPGRQPWVKPFTIRRI